MDKERFNTACQNVIANSHIKCGIGTLKEKTLHAVLKHYFEPDVSNHEKKIDGYVADISNDNGIIEIQTRNFDKLRKKLNTFLQTNKVTIVYPIARKKWLMWIDKNTGETTNKRKSPKTGSPYEAFFELYKIKQLLTNPNILLCIVMVDIEEYRNLDGWSVDKKKGSSRYERIPVEIADELKINNISDYIKLIPSSLPNEFTVKDYKKATKISLRTAGLALNVLKYVGAVKCVGKTGKKGNALVYTRTV